MGRNRLPIEVKKSNGTWRKDRDGLAPLYKSIPRSKVSKVPPPDITDPRAQKLYTQTLDMLLSADLVYPATMIHVHQFIYYYQLWLAAVEYLEENGEVIPSPNGRMMRNPMAATRNECMIQIKNFYEMYGATPGASAKIASSLQNSVAATPGKVVDEGVDSWGLENGEE